MDLPLPGLYIHIPFCIKKCNYCDFYSEGEESCVRRCGEDVYKRYAEALVAEIKDYGRRRSEALSGNAAECLKIPEKIDTVYIGGGTPSLIGPELIKDIIDAVNNFFDVVPRAEITIECNPGTVSRNKLEIYKKAGINRLSMGIQSLDNELLSFLGRIHDRDAAVNSLKLSQEYFDNVNVDLMLGIPGLKGKSRSQKLSDVSEALDFVCENSVRHVSFYSLIKEEGTPVDEWYRQGRLDEVQDDIEREMYYLVKDRLNGAGYVHYEISNFALEGYESRHNMKYWSGATYLGVGGGAVSFLEEGHGLTGKYVRFSNRSDIRDYIGNQGDFSDVRSVEEILSFTDRKKEYMMLGFRKTSGPDPALYRRLFEGSEMEKDFERELKELREEGLISAESGGFSLTGKGLDFANEIFMKFI